uniref:Ankyrin repeat containing protein n=1 Tax=Marseillevirus sp. TaxID=2809551 RepID=A0AA96ELZ7_9VIRU|nr:ankyrin repeat containing protein [Marseillevirus sp.]
MESLVFGVPELCEHIFSFLKVEDVFPCAFVSSRMNEACVSRKDWENLDKVKVMTRALWNGNVRLVRFLLEKLSFPKCNTFFDYAVHSGGVQMLRYIDKIGCQPTHHHFDELCSLGSIDCIAFLWSKGVRPSRRSSWLFYTVWAGHLPVLKWFKKRGVKIPGQRVAELAIEHRKHRILDWCLSTYPSLDQKRLFEKSLEDSPLRIIKRFWKHRPTNSDRIAHLVSENGNKEVFEFLWEQGVHFSDYDLKNAVSNGITEAIEFLSPRVEHDRSSLFSIAAYECNINTMECLYSLGYVPDESCFFAADGTVPCLDWLLKKNCPVPHNLVQHLERNYNTDGVAWAKENGLA